MKASKYIKELKKLIDEYGDREFVKWSTSRACYTTCTPRVIRGKNIMCSQDLKEIMETEGCITQ